jgi:hypothetical protein
VFAGKSIDWGGGVASIIPQEGGVVYGSLVVLNENELRRLDGYEGVFGGHYRQLPGLPVHKRTNGASLFEDQTLEVVQAMAMSRPT